MTVDTSLQQYLSTQSAGRRAGADLAGILTTIAETGAGLARIIAMRGQPRVAKPEWSDSAAPGAPPALECLSQELFVDALRKSPIAFIASKKCSELLHVDASRSLAVVLDPLDGYSNIETNTAIGVMFSVLATNSRSLFETRLCDMQVAAGFLFYGAQTLLVLSCGDGVLSFLLDPAQNRFSRAGDALTIPERCREFAINTSNYRFWDDNLRCFIDDCVAGESGPLGVDFNMRWNASLVAEAYRILRRGGVFLYPGDSRPGFENGRLRLLYEALPLAFLVEQAGGMASDGSERILDMRLASLDCRVPLVFGSRDRVREVIDYSSGDALQNTRFPLFEKRSLFRN